jgi:hypothetical protein
VAEEIRCPMCSKLNPPDSEECAFCHARLKPLLAGPAREEAGASPSAPAPGGSAEQAGQEDWLARMRSGASDEEPEQVPNEEGEEPGGSPDWLGRLRQVGPVDEGPPAGEIPDWLGGSEGGTAGEAAAAAEQEEPTRDEPAQIPDWLARVRERQAQEGPSEPGPEAPASEVDEAWLARIRDSGEPVGEGLPSGHGPLDQPKSEPEPEGPTGMPSAQGGVGAPREPGAGEGVPDDSELAWVRDSGADMSWLDGAVAEGEAGASEAPQGEAAGSGWLSELEAPAGEPAPRTGGERTPWLGEAEIVAEQPFTSLGDEIGEPEPGEADWLKELKQGADQPSSWQDQGAGGIWEAASGGNLEWLAEYDASAGRGPAERPEEPVPSEAGGAPDWLAELNQPGGPPTSATPEEIQPPQPEEPLPPPMPEPEPEEPKELPHVPALVFSDQAKPAPPQEGDFDLGSLEVELPDWLGEQKTGESEGGLAGADLAPATLPAWLEAMRPISTFRSVVDVAEEEEETLESAGPLAGLRGVLMAEPVMAMPRAPTIGSAKLEVTERQYQQADMLHQMIEEEEQEVPSPATRKLRIPLLRWAVSAVMLLAVVLPITTGVPAFPLPTQTSQGLKPLIALVNNVPVDRPTLIVFDFDPGYSGELDAVAGAFLDQVMARGIPVVSLSTRPSGPALAVGLLDRVAARHGISPGTGYMHLGYLSGGPTAVQVFAAAPREAVRKGFDLPKTAEGDDVCSGWDCPILSGVQRLSDFGMVAVISSGTESARIWAEQAHPYLGQVPLVMVLSAGAEPLIRPYYEALQPQVNGILSGLPDAVAYEQANAMPGEASSRWNPFGTALVVAEVMLAAGVVYGLAKWSLPGVRGPHE